MHKALVTGGTRGIGRAIAAAILAGGGSVVVTGRSQKDADESAGALGRDAGEGSRAIGLALDVRDRNAVDRVVAESASRLGGLNVLINNAGVGVFKEAASMSDEEWDRVIATNLTGVFYCTRAALPLLRRDGGWIINIASLAGRNYFATAGAYCATKAGLVAFSESVMLEERDRNVRVSVIMPGSVATAFSHPREHDDDSWKLRPEDIAEVVMDLLRHPGRSLPSKVEIRPSKTK